MILETVPHRSHPTILLAHKTVEQTFFTLKPIKMSWPESEQEQTHPCGKVQGRLSRIHCPEIVTRCSNSWLDRAALWGMGGGGLHRRGWQKSAPGKFAGFHCSPPDSSLNLHHPLSAITSSTSCLSNSAADISKQPEIKNTPPSHP